MDWNRVSGLWTEYQGVAKANWGRLTDNDMTAISGSRDLLIGKLQTRYGLTKDQAEQQVDNWVATLAFTATKPFMQAAEPVWPSTLCYQRAYRRREQVDP